MMHVRALPALAYRGPAEIHRTIPTIGHLRGRSGCSNWSVRENPPITQPASPGRVEPVATRRRLLVVGRRVTVVGRHRRHHTRGLPLRIAGAMLLCVSAGIHLDLYLTGYRTIPTIGWLFLVQFIGGFTLAIAVLVTHSRLAVAASAAFALSTLSAYLLAVWVGLFGFKEIRTRAGIAAGLIEVAAFAVLALAAAAAGPERETDSWMSTAARRVARVHSAVSIVIGAVGAVSILALALLGVAIADASGAPVATG